MRALKELAKRSKLVLIAAAVFKNARAWWTARGGAPSSISGSTHAELDLDASLAYIDRVYDDYIAYGRLTPELLLGARVLELGPGDNFGVALRFLAAGARQVVAVDKFVSERSEAQQRRIYEALVARLSPEGRAAIGGLVRADGSLDLDDGRLRVIEGLAIERAPAELRGEAFDLIVSRAVLEHVYDPEAAFDAIDALLAPGGVIVHKIDFRDHGMFTAGGMHPLTFLTIGDRLYRWMTRHSGEPNRHIIDWYREKTAALGYEDRRLLATHVLGQAEELDPYVERLEPAAATTDLIAQIRDRLRPRYRILTDADLATSGLMLVARKPDGAAERQPGRATTMSS